MKKLLALAAALLLIPACRSSTDANFSFQFESIRLDAPPAQAPVTDARVESGLIVVTGGTVTQCTLDRVVLDADRDGTTLTVRVLREPPQTCQSATQHHAWTGVFAALGPGTYHVVVSNEVTGTPVVELEEDIVLQ